MSASEPVSPEVQARILSEALPYMQRYDEEIIVVKYGGHAMGDEHLARDFARADQGVSEFLAESNRTVVLQDVAALNLLETVIAAEPPGYQELSINIDTGGLAARRLLADQIAAGDSARVPATVTG